MKKQLRAFLGAVIALSMSAQAFAVGGGNYTDDLLSVRSLGQGDTGVAGVQDDPISAYSNPAALTSIQGTRINVNLHYINVKAGYTAGAGQLVPPGSQASSHATSVVVPSFGVSTRFMDGKLGVGMSIASPYGLESHWDPLGPLRYIATDSRLGLVVISPAVAYKVMDQLSVGVGLDYANVLEGALSKQINQAAFGGTADGSSRLNANGDGWGYHLGVKYMPTEHHAIGLVYHSKIKLALSGNVQLTGLNAPFVLLPVFGQANYTTPITTSLYLPQNIQLGYAFMPTDKWQFEINGAWFDWSSAGSLGIVYPNASNTPVGGLGLGQSQSSVLNANNPQQFFPRKTVSLGFGANYKQNDKLQWRAGGYYMGASMAEAGFDPAVNDLPRYGFAFGGSYAFTKMIGMDWAYSLGFFHSRYITNTANGGTPATLSGNFMDRAHILAAALTVKLPEWGDKK